MYRLPENSNRNLDTLTQEGCLVSPDNVACCFRRDLASKIPAFNLMLHFIKLDFNLPDSLPLHFALLPSMDGNDQQSQQNMDANRLKRFGVLPVFYSIIKDNDGKENHEALPALIEELATDLGISGIPSPDDISQRFLRP